jgi:hypothetical protein
MDLGDCVSISGRFLHHAGRNFAARPASCTMGTEVYFPGVKRSGREAKLLDSFSALVQKRCVTPLLPTNGVATWTGTSLLAGTS